MRDCLRLTHTTKCEETVARARTTTGGARSANSGIASQTSSSRGIFSDNERQLLVRLTRHLTGLAEETIEEARTAQPSMTTTTEGAVNVNEALAATLGAARTSLQNNLEALDESTARLKDAMVLRDTAERATGKLEPREHRIQSDALLLLSLVSQRLDATPVDNDVQAKLETLAKLDVLVEEKLGDARLDALLEEKLDARVPQSQSPITQPTPANGDDQWNGGFGDMSTIRCIPEESAPSSRLATTPHRRRTSRRRQAGPPTQVLLPRVESNDDDDRASNSDYSTSSRDLSTREFMRRLLEELGGDTDHSGSDKAAFEWYDESASSSIRPKQVANRRIRKTERGAESAD
ncbi:hypothetical protein THAOC_01384 [Thalassiosira oceanica]|uniref:Uncharacterized protein n=1 Tax=Thalassiosira oceanica TaxID=159749 RepID=K0TQY0_THAOC|nr:hypothetical protein THAOC_01384 [Thalassiosira oceanica]|eukprot:EJK76832.1 hypothetical protein THAOC_01384 [Thalassiosira oceanica]